MFDCAAQDSLLRRTAKVLSRSARDKEIVLPVGNTKRAHGLRQRFLQRPVIGFGREGRDRIVRACPIHRVSAANIRSSPST